MSGDGGDPPDLSALVVNYNSTRHAMDMLESLARQEPKAPDGRPLSMEFVFVDNASPDLDDEALSEIRAFAEERLPGRILLHGENLGYAGGMNLAFEHARGTHLLVLNPDLVFMPGCLTRLYAHLRSHPRTGAAGPRGFWDSGRDVHLPPNILPTLGELLFNTLAHVSPSVNRRYVDWRVKQALTIYRAEEDLKLSMLSGACLMIPRAVAETLIRRKGGSFFDGGFPLYYEDTDLFRRIRSLGMELCLVRDAEIVHFYNRSGTTNPEEAMRRYWRAKAYYYRKYYGLPGRFLEALCRRFLESGWAKRGRLGIEKRAKDLGEVSEPPTLVLGKHCETFLLEFCQDAAFLLAAAMFGKGDRWTPGESFWNAFGNSEYFLRAVDLTDGKQEEVAVFRFRRVGHPALPREKKTG